MLSPCMFTCVHLNVSFNLVHRAGFSERINACVAFLMLIFNRSKNSCANVLLDIVITFECLFGNRGRN